MRVERLFPTQEAQDLLDLVTQIGTDKLAPRASADEEAAAFPRDVFTLLGHAGLLSLPFPEEFGGGAQPYEVYLQVLEELATHWMSVAVGVSVHSLVCSPVAKFGTPEQQERWLPWILDGTKLGGYCLSETGAGSDVAAMATKATRTDDGYVLSGTKSWITHAGHADFYTVFARTGEDRTKGISAFIVPADTPGITFGTPERKMGMTASHTGDVIFDQAHVPTEYRIGAEGEGMSMALGALDSGRLGISACATGLAQAALNAAVDYARDRQQFGKAISEFQGVQFLLADMAAAVAAARASYLHAARLRDAGRPYTREASAAKLVATDAAMKVTTDAVQVFGGAGYVKDWPVERFMREAKVTQIFEGTNQIQRVVIARDLLKRQGR